MRHLVLCLAIGVVQHAAEREAYSRPPDQVPFSPVPPLVEPQKQAASSAGHKVGPINDITRQMREQQSKFAKPVTNAKARQQSSNESKEANESSQAGAAATQQEIWKSADMMSARAAVMQFCRRSAQTSEIEGQQFLEQLAQLSPSEMQNWLERFRARERKNSYEREADRGARQLGVEFSIQRQQERRQLGLSIADQRQQAAAAAQPVAVVQIVQGPRYLAPEDYLSRSGIYNPFEVVIDPASPRGYRRKVAAAMSLPGDLPRSDPRNFLRGDEGINLDEWADARGIEPPIPGLPPIGVLPTPPVAPVAP